MVPSAEHRHCIRHLHNNFKQEYGGLELKQGSTAVVLFEDEMSKLQNLDGIVAYQWLKRAHVPRTDPTSKNTQIMTFFSTTFVNHLILPYWMQEINSLSVC